MNTKPTGNVTFLFSDIEGSTKLAHKFPARLKEILERHNSILKNAIDSNNGFIFKTVGDSFCISFGNVNDAIITAVESQKKFLEENLDEHKVKVRMGIHNGEAEWMGDDYRSYLTMSRVQRIMSAAYGEQILISNDAYELAIEKIPSEISFRDLGERRLKDVIQPIRLFQIVSKGLREDFPPLKTLDARPNNLPVQLTSFIGREEEMKQVKNLIKQTHLLTLTGSGGSGKTRLALQVVADLIDDFANGVWFVELASLLEPELLPQAIIKVFGLKEESKRSPENMLCDYLKDKEMLIILDNCEHLIEVCAKLTEKILSNSPKLKIISTSREALRCEGEQTHRVLSLAIPDPQEDMSPEKLSQYEAVRLFIERALAVDSTFRVNNNNAPALAQICYQLDGIPLTIELAAARTKVLSVEKIYERLNDRFNLLTVGKRTALPRQQTLRALIDWSYDLLSEQEKILWRRLSVFSVGWTLEAAEVICSDDKISEEEVINLLNNLAEKSIIIFDEENERYRMLETIRRYGEEKLKETVESENISRNHLKIYMEFAELAEQKLYGNEMQTWLEKLDTENGNLEKALLWSLEGSDSEKGMRLAGALGYFWKVRGHFSAGRRWLESVLGNSPVVTNPARGKAQSFAGELAHLQGEFEKARKLTEESLAMHQEIGDKSGIAFSLNTLGNVAFFQGEYGRARELYEESIANSREIESKYYIASSLNNLGNVGFYQGDYKRAGGLYEESLTIRREIGDKRGIAASLNNLGNVAFNQGEYGTAWKLHEECLTIYRMIRDRLGIALSINNLGVVAFEQREYRKALGLHEESVTIYREIGDKSGIAFSLNSLGSVVYQQQEYNRAQEFYEESLDISREIGNKYYMAFSLNSLGNVAFEKGKYEQARKFYEESLTLTRELKHKKDIVINILGLAGIQDIKGYHKEAARLIGIIEEVLQSMGAVLERHENNLYERTVSELKEKLGEEEFTRCLAEGKAMTLEQAIELAFINEQ